MGYYEDHINVVAARMAERLKNGAKFDIELWKLASFGWSSEEIKIISEKAQQIAGKEVKEK